MATLVAAATGNLTTAATWLVCNATAETDSEASTVTVTTSNVDGTAFTPGAITVTGIMIKPRTRPGTTGTLTVTLRNSTAGSNVDSVTINMADIPATPTDSAGSAIPMGWIYLEFAAPILLLAATNYLIRVVASNNSQLTLYGSTTTNMSKQLVTSSAPGAAPAAGDKLIVCGKRTGAGASSAFTVTMDNTASVTYGTEALTQSVIVSDRGSLTWGNSSSTAYLMQVAGILLIGSGGTMTIPTMPSSSTAILDFVVTTNVLSGIRVHGGTLNATGATKTLITTLTATAASGQPDATVANVTGWANNDELVFTPTRRVAAQHETKIIQSIASLTVTLTANLANNHDGSGTALAPNNPRGHVGCLTHNVKIRGTSNVLRCFLYASTGSTVALSYTEIKWCGAQATAGKNGISIDPAVTSFSMTNCSMWNFGQVLPQAATWNNITITGCVLYNGDNTCINFSTASTNSNWTVSSNLIIASNSNSGIRLAGFGGTCSNNILCGHSAGITLTGASAAAIQATPGTIAGNEAYGNADGMVWGGNVPYGMIVGTLTCWRNTSTGINVNGYNYECQLNSFVGFGSTTANLQINATSALTMDLIIKAAVLNGETSFGSAHGLWFGANQIFARVFAESCVFSSVVAHTGDDVGWSNIPGFELYMDNPAFGASTEIQAFTGASGNWQSPGAGSFVRVQKYDGAAGDHREFTVYGTRRTDSTTYHTAAPSEQLTPSQASYKFQSAPKRYGASSGQVITASVYVRKSATYNGNQPRLIARRNPAVGAASDVVLDTMTAAVGNWEQLTGAAAALSGDAGAIEFYVDCDGTVGSVNVDDWAFSRA